MKIRVVLDSVRDQNLKQMKQLNAAIFPVKYQVSSNRSKVSPFPTSTTTSSFGQGRLQEKYRCP